MSSRTAKATLRNSVSKNQGKKDGTKERRKEGRKKGRKEGRKELLEDFHKKNTLYTPQYHFLQEEDKIGITYHNVSTWRKYMCPIGLGTFQLTNSNHVTLTHFHKVSKST